MNRLTRSFSSVIPWSRCPRCVTIINVDKAHILEKRDFDWSEYGAPCGKFSALIPCEKCHTIISTSGNWSIEPYSIVDEDGNQDIDYAEQYHINHCLPAPKLIAIKNEWPKKVREAFFESFELFWKSNEMAAVSLRKVLEALCTYLKIDKKNLHQRLEFICSNDYENGFFKHLEDIGLAAKWLGNDGAHQINSIDNTAIQFLFEATEIFIDSVLKGPHLRE